MTEEKQQQQSVTFPASVLIALIVAAGGVALIDGGLESTRPQDSVESYIHNDVQAVDARLWEDPLRAIQDINSQEAKSLRDDPSYEMGSYAESNVAIVDEDELKRWISIGGADRCPSPDFCTTVIAVLVPDSPYALSAERRRRIRYAVVAALSEDFLPQDSERIGVARIASDAQAEPTRSPPPQFLAFEGFQSEFSADGRRVIILWVPQRLAAKDPLRKVRDLLEDLVPKERGFRKVLLGPPDSNGLAELYKEIAMLDVPVDERVAVVLDNHPDIEDGESKRIGSIVLAAAEYLDDGLPPTTDIDELVDCLHGPATPPVVEACLAARGIPDSDEQWQKAVTEEWFSENSFSPDYTADIDTSMSALRGAIDDYLDAPLLETQLTETSLTACLPEPWNPSVFARCLAQQGASEGIRDSDEAWHLTIANGYAATLRQNHIAAEVEKHLANRNTERSRPGAILREADDYLDEGLSINIDLEKTVACLVDAATVGAISACLQLIGQQDSDPDWYSNVADYWWRNNVVDRDYTPRVAQREAAESLKYYPGITNDIERAFAETVAAGTAETLTKCLGRADSEAAAFACATRSSADGKQFAQVGSVIRSAIEYLVDGIRSPDMVPPLVRCLTSSTLSSEVISGCLQALEVDDFNDTWYSSVADVWWKTNARPLAPTEAQLVEQLRAELDRYLDDGFSDEDISAAQLLECVRRAVATDDYEGELASCLRENGTAIRDSDEGWYDTVAQELKRATRGVQLGRLVQERLDQASEFERVVSLLIAADDYLDNGIPAAIDIDSTVGCLAKSTENSAIAGCLRLLGINDSDVEWENTIAGDWSREKSLFPSYFDWKAEVVALSTGSWGYKPSYENWKRNLETDRAEHYAPLVSQLEHVLPMKSGALERVGSIFAAALQVADPVDEQRQAWTDVNALLRNLGSTAACLRSVGLEAEDLAGCLQPAFDAAVATDASATWSAANAQELPSWWKEDLTLLSPQATIPAAILRDQYLLEGELDRATEFSRRFIFPTLSDDSFVAKALFDELALRDVEKNDPIALVYEHDTRYGRALQQLLDCGSKYWRPNPAVAVDASAPCFSNIATYGYLRGLDGVGPSEPSANDSSEGGEPLLLGTAPDNSLEMPMGSHQFDYLRRLADDIADAQPVAIGILGTDIFDKRLILQALRNESPDALFFTTDVDAALEDRGEYRILGNLVIASSHGFSHDACPGGSTGAKSPPFRDNYQTSYFLAACAAAGINGETDLSPDMFAGDVRVYEVARTGLFDLSAVGDLSWRDRSARSIVVEALIWLALCAPLLILIGYSSAHLGHARVKIKDLPLAIRPFAWGMRLGLIGLVVLVALFVLEYAMGPGEPYQAAIGVSARPAIILEVSVIVLALFFFVFAYYRVKASNRELEQDYGLPSHGATEKGTAAKVWSDYRVGFKSEVRNLRFVWVISSAVALLAYLVLTPHPPLVRGPFSWDVGDLPMALVVLALLITTALTVLFADQLMRCRELVRALGEGVQFSLPPNTDPRPFVESALLWSPVAAIDLIARRTEAISSLPVLLFVLLTLMVLSSSGIFEGWEWSWALTVLYVTICGSLVVAAFLLQREAERSRGKIIRRLRMTPKSQLARKQIDAAIEHIGSIRRGAFVDWFRHPLLQAVLLPSTAPAVILAIQSLLA